MSNIIEFRTVQDELDVHFEVMSSVDISVPITKEKVEKLEKLSYIDNCLTENQKIINDLNSEIDRLTNKADGIDYTIAVASGIISSLIDSFFVGDFSLDRGTQWGKEKVDAFVKSIAENKGYSGDSIDGAVRFLEEKFPIPADSATNIFGGGYNHHLRDFSHHPTPMGLLFSMLTQFTGKVFGTDKSGAFIVEDVPSKELIGKDLSRKLEIGFVNWIFHMVSDIAGSSSSIAKGKYGTGLPGPFVSLLKELSSLPFFSHKDSNNNKFCVWLSKLFNGTLLSERDENGKIIPNSVIKFDLRAELGVLYELKRQAIPVIINECIVRVSYFVRRLLHEFTTKEIHNFNDFIYVIDWEKTFPSDNRTIARMVSIASSTFVAIDAADAAIRSALNSGGEPASFFTNMILKVNFVGIGRFAVAIGTDTYMGYKRSKLRNERMYRQSEQIFLSTAKVYYKQADMWVAAKDAREAITQMEVIAIKSIEYFQESIITIGLDLEKIISYREGIEKHNPNLLTDLSDILKYGK